MPGMQLENTVHYCRSRCSTRRDHLGVVKEELAMKIGSGDHVYTWVDDWARIPPDEAATKGWSHHDAVVRADGRIVSCHQGKPTILSFDPDGNVVDSCDAPITEAHGMSIASDGDGEVLWIGDTGRKRLAEINYDYPDDAKPSEAVKLDFAGNALMRIGQPDLDFYTGRSVLGDVGSGPPGEARRQRRTYGWRTATAKAGCTDTPNTGSTLAASTERRAGSAGSTPRTDYWWTTEKPIRNST